MGKLIISMHVTLDGFVAGTNGEMDWVNFDDEMFDYVGHLTDGANVALYGRNTFQMMDSYWPAAGDPPDASKHDKQHSEWYNKVDKLVLSNTMKGQNKNKVQFIDETELNKVKEALKDGNVLIFGSPGAIHTLFRHNMVDEMYLFINPVTLGAGIPLYNGIQNKLQWKLQENKTFVDGKVVSLYYTRI